MTVFVVNGAGDTPAHLACREGNVENLRQCYERCPMILEIKNKIGKVPLHDAAQFGHLDCIRFLITKKVDVNPLKRGDWTPLMLACTKNNLDVVKNLIESGSKAQLVNKDGWNCFQLACREGHIDIIGYLLDVDSNLVLSKSKNGRTPLHIAALHGHMGLVELLLAQDCICPDIKDNCGVTPFMDAIKCGHNAVAEFLFSTRKVDINEKDFIGGRMAIHLAAETGCCEAIKYLIHRCGTSVNSMSTFFHETPLHLAAKEGHTEATRLLLELGADKMLQDSRHRTAFEIALLNKKEGCAKLLMEGGDD